LELDSKELTLLVGLVIPACLCKILPLLCRHSMTARRAKPDRLTKGQQDAQAFLITWGVITADDEEP
jgi:hypothetical protein